DGGSPGPFYAGKGTTWEAGHRVPAIFWAPGRIEPGTVRGIGSTLDLLPTLSRMAGVSVPDDREMDGFDLSPTLLDGAESPREEMIYYGGQEVFAVRRGPYKAHFVTRGAYGQFGEREEHDPPLLYHLGRDPGETTDIGSAHPDIIAELRALRDAHTATVVPVKDQLAERE
ncbi:MAG: sulfatase-like hydrolase/transferase, partial [Lewinella sp.]